MKVKFSAYLQSAKITNPLQSENNFSDFCSFPLEVRIFVPSNLKIV